MTDGFTHETIYALTEELERTFGDDLQGVFFGHFLDDDYSVVHLHDDVTTALDPGQIREVTTSLIDEQIACHDTDALEHFVGKLTTTVRCFEDASQVLVWKPREEVGLFVSLDPDPANVSPLLETLRAYELA